MKKRKTKQNGIYEKKERKDIFMLVTIKLKPLISFHHRLIANKLQFKKNCLLLQNSL